MTVTITDRDLENPTQPAFIVFGVDSDKEPRAAWFDASQPKLVARAAELMNLNLCAVTSPAIAEVAKEVPVGHLYANGSGFVPKIKYDLYAKLSATVAAEARTASSADGDDQAGSPGLPRDWDEIGPGHLVVANEGPGNGWWDAIVVEVNGDMLTLHWRDFPWQPDVVQHRSNVALINPAQ
jgi:hypothetical protein